ncbi:hypothetical protein IAG44_37375 [Streptomyces roseirectus]|uniref:Uncharacterized protein n=1 Tax=Streptomyces roseirectus TaxID=2768066 RepID=A0A7H0IP56_9ACTN|nr:hypothetical protein [Streptomyces roseirectus]QNP74572.1 hypothetical protein IAG44_37375 [Streptomyces roseirectus]
MTTLLEARYRTALRLLPAYYRREREEEMVETYLWGVDRDTQDQSRPTAGEVASIVALAVRTRLGAAGAPRRYALLGASARRFALFAVLLQAASAVVDRVLELTWGTTHGPAQWDLFLTRFNGHGPGNSVPVAVLEWTLPLLWTVAYAALLRDRRGLAGTAAALAALPELWVFAAPFVTDAYPPDLAYATANGLLAWLTVLALCAAYHRDAPPAALPAGTPGLVYLAACVVMGASQVALPPLSDSVWAPATAVLLAGLAWLLRRPRTPDTAFALAALGALVLALRVTTLSHWFGVLPAVVRFGSVVQAAVLLLLTAALTVVAGRSVRERAGRA